MKTATLAIAAVTALALAPGWALARDITGQLTQTQVDTYCSSQSRALGPATFDLGHGKSATGTVDCAPSEKSSQTTASGTDDNGVENGVESGPAKDADSSHED